MPYAQEGEELNFSTSKFIKLKSKGDKIKFRLIGTPFYDGKHFMKDAENNWDVKPCPRINEGIECEICEMFFKAHASAKKEKLSKEETSKLTNPFKSSISFYFPILNRDSGLFEVFQTTMGVRNQIEAERKLGTKILKRDLIVLRTEIPGSYYKLSVVDSSETKKMTSDELKQVKIGKETDLSNYVSGQAEETDLADEVAEDFINETDS